MLGYYQNMGIIFKGGPYMRKFGMHNIQLFRSMRTLKLVQPFFTLFEF